MHHRRRAPPIVLSPAPPPGADDPNGHVNTIEIVHHFESQTNPAKPARPSPLTTSNGMPLVLLERLRSFPLFLSAPEEFLSAVATHLRPQPYSPRDYILTEGDEAKAMYWLVRGAVAVTSRDGESTYAELRPGAFFGEIGILMDIPRTATIIARSRCLLVVLTKEALQRELPKFPEVERAIREEAEERLTLLNKKKKERESSPRTGGVKRAVDSDGDVEIGDNIYLRPDTPRAFGGPSPTPKPGSQWVTNSALGSGQVNIRQLLKELPLFANLPQENLHFLGLSAAPRTYAPFQTIIQQYSMGREIYFIVGGEVEVVDEMVMDPRQSKVKARLRKGQHFGEVVALSLAPRRTATVRAITPVECLVIEGDVLEELWKKCPPEVQQQLETTARDRMDGDGENVLMRDAPATPTQSIDRLDISDLPKASSMNLTVPESRLTGPNDSNLVEPFDPDPYLPADFESLRSKSRRGSLAPPPPPQSSATSSSSSPTEENPSPLSRSTTPSPVKTKHVTTPPEHHATVKRARILSRKPSRFNIGQFKDDILIQIFKHMELHELMRVRQVSTHWSRLLTNSPYLLTTLDLKPYNRVINDNVLIHAIAPFVGHRPSLIDISNCFHIGDEGFMVLAQTCGANVKVWKMKSVWDITGQAILEMSNRAKGLEEIDLSNCRKVSDTLLARVVGWVVPEFHPMYAEQQLQQAQAAAAAVNNPSRYNPGQQAPPQPPPMYPAPGTVIGCPNLSRLTLSYCKHVTDRTMSHLAAHAARRLEHVDLTRCTTITDQGFQSWSMTRFERLRSLCLADCTYLTDSAVVFLTNAAKGLRSLDLSFCCALSDTATEVLSLGCPHLSVLKLSFCGSAVSDSSLRAIGLHLLELRELSVRGCVRVTGVGVEAVVEGCHNLEVFDVSQCKNLARWIESGGVEKCTQTWKRNIRFETVAVDVIAGDRRR